MAQHLKQPLAFLALQVVCSLLQLACPLIGARITFDVPMSQRTEGRINLEYLHNGELIKHQLAFSEVIDSDTQRSKVSIGYVSHPPTTYYSRAGNMLTLDQEGRCVCLKQQGYKYVPELDWFLKLSYTNAELEQSFAPGRSHHIGPSGIALMLSRRPTKYDHEETHRNIESQVVAVRYDRTRARNVLFEILVPSLEFYSSPRMNFFSLRETVKDGVNEAGEKYSTTLTIDYFYTERIDKNDPHQMDRLERDLNLPFGRGCSEFLEPVRPRTTKQSFLITYRQSQVGSVVLLAYDHEANYLRKELIGRSVAVWDLNEDLLYHVDQKLDGKLYNDVDIEVLLDSCSVLSVESKRSNEMPGENLNLLLPFDQVGSSVDVLQFLGARELHYLGLASVRELPCQVYEKILSEPPRIFDVDLRIADTDQTTSAKFEYIVQFHVFKTNQPSRAEQMKAVQDGSTPTEILLDDQFWPARIVLIQRDKKTGLLEQLDKLEVTDFHWGLYGWTKKPSEMFMLPECFNDEDEQLHLSLAIDFERLHQENNQKVLRHNKYKLEKELLDDLFRLLSISRLHLTEFELSLRPHNVLANLVISDRIDERKLTYFGTGNLPSKNSYSINRIELRDLASSEHGGQSACIMLASHVNQISMVIYCPRRSPTMGPTCTAVFGQEELVIKRPAEKKSASPSADQTDCHVYRYELGDTPQPATNDVEKIKRNLVNHRLSFETDNEPRVIFKGIISDFDVSREKQLIMISNYKYVSPAQQKTSEATSTRNSEQSNQISEPSGVRIYESIPYETLGDCTRVCDLDPACKSYSYCQDKTMLEPRCALSSLDLRQNKVENQLVSAAVTASNQVEVYDLEASENQPHIYLLDLKTGCNIYERDFLSAFAQTDELLCIDANVAKQFISEPSASECARWILSLEEQMIEMHVATFAFCANTNTCLVDGNLFVSLGNTTSDTDEPDKEVEIGNKLPDDKHELSCQVYRKRYQNYFHLSARVLKLTDQDDANQDAPFKQAKLELSTVEQCARACWDDFGHNCLSFDYCRPSSCLVNLIGDTVHNLDEMLDKVELETRPDCLHYERDLRWDQLRRDHLIGKHKPLDPKLNGQGESSLGNGVMADLALLVITLILFVMGLAIGRSFNERLESVAQLSQGSLIAHSLGFGKSRSSGRGGGGDGNNLDVPTTSTWTTNHVSPSPKFNIENEIYEDPHAIQLEELGQSRDANAEELNKSFEVEATSEKQVGPSKGYIEVPHLINV